MKDWLFSELQSFAGERRSARYALDLTEERVTLVERTSTGSVEHRSLSHDDDAFDDHVEELRAIVARDYGDKAPVDLLLPNSLVIERTDTFPADARDDLREAVWWRLETLTKFRPEDLCFDVAFRREDEDTGFLELAIAVAPKDMVEEAVDYARRWNFDPQRVSSSAALEDFEDGPTFASVDQIGDVNIPLKRSALALLAAVVLLAAIGVGRGLSEREALVVDAEEARIEATERLRDVEEIRSSALNYAARAQAPADRRATKPLAVEWLGALARILPPSASATRVVVADGVIRIEGLAENADAVLAAIETADAFETARYAADVEPQGATLQRFAIEASIIGWEGAI